MEQRGTEWKLEMLSVFLLVVALASALLNTARAGDKMSRGAPPANKSSDKMPAAASTPLQQGGYAGGDSCFACHDIEDAFKKNPHYKTWADETLAWSERGCESCHGPGQAHIDAGGNPELLFNFEEASAQESSDRCLDCHLTLAEEQVNFLRNEHGLNSVACTECHSIHTFYEEEALLAAPTPALCYDCHGEVRGQFNKPFRHKIHEGLIDCTDCHNQHGGYTPRQLRTATGNHIACYNCHMDKQGPFVFEHLGVTVEGCTACHDPHGSTNPRLLRRSEVRLLCIECHSPSPGVLGDAPPGFHNLTQIEWQNCTSCHTEIHGSNLSPFFFE